MSDVSDVIIGLFSDSFGIISKKETCDVFTIEYQVNNISKNFSETDDWRKTIINSRDLIEVSFFEEEEEDPISYLSNVKNSWNDFIIDLQNSSFQQGKIKIHIEKKFQNNRLSIYDIESFTEYKPFKETIVKESKVEYVKGEGLVLEKPELEDSLLFKKYFLFQKLKLNKDILKKLEVEEKRKANHLLDTFVFWYYLLFYLVLYLSEMIPGLMVKEEMPYLKIR